VGVNKKIKIVFTGGGTAGHVNPAINIANQLKNTEDKENTEILFIGTKHGIESILVPKAGYKIEFIKVVGLKRKLSLENIKSIYMAIKSLFDARKILKKFKPDLVIGTGGYVSGPVIWAANTLKIPTLIHEQNAFPGVTTKLLVNKVDVICLGFIEAVNHMKIKKTKVIYTGNPTQNLDMINTGRTDVKFRAKLLSLVGFKYDAKPLIIVFGGSLGSAKINNVIPSIAQKNPDINFLLITGTRFYDEISMEVLQLNLSNLKIQPYLNNLCEYMSISDLVICRSGAMTVSEICNLGVPSILVPSPNVTQNHQEYNARFLEKSGGCKVILESEFNVKNVNDTLKQMFNHPEVLKNMSKNSLSISKPNSSQLICNEIMSTKIPTPWRNPYTNFK